MVKDTIGRYFLKTCVGLVFILICFLLAGLLSFQAGAVFKPGENPSAFAAPPENNKQSTPPRHSTDLNSQSAPDKTVSGTPENDSNRTNSSQSINATDTTSNANGSTGMNLWLIGGGVALVLVLIGALVWRLKKR